MPTDQPKLCPSCGARLPVGARAELCPACLLSDALAPEEGSAAGLPPGEEATFPLDWGGYRLLGQLGTGGMGTVYEALHLTTGRRVALKMLKAQLDSPEVRQRFLREGRLAASVNHPNSLYVFGAEEFEGLPLIAMEVAAGGTLEDVLKKRGPLPVDEAVDAMLDVISGLEAAQAKGVLHRDIKPSNCFLTPGGEVKVGDYGLSVSTLAKDDSYATATGVIMGTPAFAPPEQLRGDELDLRADIYSVGATLYTLLSGRAPFGGKNAVQVVANAVNQKPQPLGELREEVSPELERVVSRCLAKDPAGRFEDYRSLRDALLPFSSREPEPVPLNVRAAAGWIDFLLALMPTYVPLMLIVGGGAFHMPLALEPSLYAARFHLVVFGGAFVYFSLSEGLFGAGVGKRLRGLRVVGPDGRPPGILRALVRIFVIIFTIEAVRLPLLWTVISATRPEELTGAEVAWFFALSHAAPFAAVLLSLTARQRNGFATLWDLASGTRVVVQPRSTAPVRVDPVEEVGREAGAPRLGPFQPVDWIVPGKWVEAVDPILRRRVWLLLRGEEPQESRRGVGRPGRLRWLQQVDQDEATWDAFEAIPGRPLLELVEGKVAWGTLRYWLHDLASELWAGEADGTLPKKLGIDQVWIGEHGHAVLLDEPWPGLDCGVERVASSDLESQQSFLNTVAQFVEPTGVPLHARPLLENLEAGKFERMSFLAGTLRGLLEKPSEVSRPVRAGSIFLISLYVWLMFFIGEFGEADGGLVRRVGDPPSWVAIKNVVFVLASLAAAQLISLPFGANASQAVFRLAIVDGQGQRASSARLLLRWLMVWAPLLVPLAGMLSFSTVPSPWVQLAVAGWIGAWIAAAAYAALHPHRGVQDKLARTWVVRR